MPPNRPRLTALAALLLAAACGSDPMPARDSGSAPSADAGPDPASDAADQVDAAPGQAVPTDADALFAYLSAGDYRDFAAEADIHPSSGPHGAVRTYFNELLVTSLEAGAATHPTGAASIKELYDGGTLTGWAVAVKTDADSAGGDGWYWYEVLDTAPGTEPIADGNGVGLCAGCHEDGADFIFSPGPA